MSLSSSRGYLSAFELAQVMDSERGAYTNPNFSSPLTNQYPRVKIEEGEYRAYPTATDAGDSHQRMGTSSLPSLGELKSTAYSELPSSVPLSTGVQNSYVGDVSTQDSQMPETTSIQALKEWASNPSSQGVVPHYAQFAGMGQVSSVYTDWGSEPNIHPRNALWQWAQDSSCSQPLAQLTPSLEANPLIPSIARLPKSSHLGEVWPGWCTDPVYLSRVPWIVLRPKPHISGVFIANYVELESALTSTPRAAYAKKQFKDLQTAYASWMSLLDSGVVSAMRDDPGYGFNQKHRVLEYWIVKMGSHPGVYCSRQTCLDIGLQWGRGTAYAFAGEHGSSALEEYANIYKAGLTFKVLGCVSERVLQLTEPVREGLIFQRNANCAVWAWYFGDDDVED